MSASSALRVCCLLLCLVAGSRQLSIKEFVVPDAVEVNENAELRCQYELAANETDAALFVKWWWTPANAPRHDKRHIYQRIAGHAAEAVHNSRIKIKENDTIVLLQLSPSDSGTYECEVSQIDEIRQHDELVVFTKGSGPELNISTLAEGTEDDTEHLSIQCEATGVAPLPDLIVTFNNGIEVNITETVNGPNSEGLYSIFANTTLPKDEIKEGDVRCELLFTNPNVTHPQYVDVEAYNPADGEVSTAAPAEPTRPEATTESLLNSRDHSYRLHCSWVLLVVAGIMTRLHANI